MNCPSFFVYSLSESIYAGSPETSGFRWGLGQSPNVPNVPRLSEDIYENRFDRFHRLRKKHRQPVSQAKGLFYCRCGCDFPRADRRRRRGAARNPPGVRRRRVFRRVARPRKARPARLCRRAEARNAQRHSPPDDPFGNQASARPPRRAGANRRRRRSAAVRVRNGLHVRYRLGRPRGAGNADSAPFRARRAEPRAGRAPH